MSYEPTMSGFIFDGDNPRKEQTCRYCGKEGESVCHYADDVEECYELEEIVLVRKDGVRISKPIKDRDYE